jgi:hypothetical protein
MAMAKIILVSGASSGIGLAIAKRLILDGHRVYGISRNFSAGKFDFPGYDADVTRPADTQQVIDEILKKEGRIDVLINSAGYSFTSPIEFCSQDELRAQMETNFFGLVSLTRQMVPSLRNQRNGMIIQISSIGGIMGLPYQGMYSAAKFALEGFSEALSMELRNFNVKVKLILPGDTRTNLTSARKEYAAKAQDHIYAASYRRALEKIVQDEHSGVHPDRIAQRVSRLIRRKNSKFRHVVCSPLQRVAVILKRILPFSWFEAILSGHYKI